MPGRVLVVDDEKEMCEVLAAGLGARGFAVDYVVNAADAFARLQQHDYDTVVTDLFMRGESGIELCSRISASFPNVPVVVITAFGSMESAVSAIRAGAYDFVTKPLDTDELALIFDRAIQLRGLREEVKRLRHALDQTGRFASLLGESDEMKRLTSMLARLSDSDASVLVTGETGTGKEMVARSLHDASRRANGPFVPINCAAMPETLLESELFGHTKGAYTDAKSQRKGLFLQANGGTLFLDEIGSLPLSVQPKLLRVLQDHRVRPVGSDEETPIDVRVISATNRDLESAAAEGSFRDDLFFRINVIHIDLPPLRSRGNDVLLLAQHFVKLHAERARKAVVGLSSAVAQKLLTYPWPGNVRELQNCVERAVALCQCDKLTVEDLPEKIRSYTPAHVVIAGDNPTELATMEEVEKRYIQRVLESVNGNKTLAARILGFDRKTLYRKLDALAGGRKSTE